MQTIHKCSLSVVDDQIIELTKGAEILTVQTQYDVPVMWYKINTDNIDDKEKRTILTYGTGHPIHAEPLKYIGTYQLQSGSLVFHVFELTQS